MDELFAAIKALWNANTTLSSMFKNQLLAGEVQELTGLPNAVIRPVNQGKKTQSNKTLYEKVVFELEIVDGDFERLGTAVKAVGDVVRYAALNQYLIANQSRYTLLTVFPPTTTYVWDERYWKATGSFEAWISSTVSPARN